jgi:hypothetical protein
MKCIECQHWTETKPELRFGHCSKFNMQTEWNAGIRWQTRKRIAICPCFAKKNVPVALEMPLETLKK